MNITIKVNLKDVNICKGCPCTDVEVDLCQLFNENLYKSKNGQYLRCLQCIDKYGK